MQHRTLANDRVRGSWLGLALVTVFTFVVQPSVAQDIHWAPRPNPALEEHTRAEFRLTAKPIWIKALQTEYAAIVGRLINLKTAYSTLEAAPALTQKTSEFSDERAESLKPEIVELAKRMDEFKQSLSNFDQKKICSDRKVFDQFSLAASTCMYFGGKCIRVLTDEELFGESQSICSQEHAVLLGMVPPLSSTMVALDQIMANLSWRIERLKSKTIFEGIRTSPLSEIPVKSTAAASLRASLSSVKNSKTCDEARSAYADFVGKLAMWRPAALKNRKSAQGVRIESTLQRVFVSNSDLGLTQCGYLQAP
ncbi:hypothetical protein ML401_20590 [Bradyrhizobium sp. 62B]|uniref:hypothetical protein n=1 Tax=Bradyrhizobium sp. 62B TaxID=2898442 RepID=UPI002557D4B2|nr:hypothetical protein ML401_20590 [Bradyrhizobium sp. 62B]